MKRSRHFMARLRCSRLRAGDAPALTALPLAQTVVPAGFTTSARRKRTPSPRRHGHAIITAGDRLRADTCSPDTEAWGYQDGQD